MAKYGESEAGLFPILQTTAPVGLARLAAEATHHADGHQVEFRSMKVRSVLNKSVSKRQLSLAYSINPYRGCEFGCRYCYARYTHEFMAGKEPIAVGLEVGGPEGNGSGVAGPDLRDPEMFERLIFLKESAAWLLEQELRRIDPAEEIALGTATDPYQPVERTAKITRSLLEVFARKSGYRLGIITKSKLITRDLDLLVEIARRNTLVLHVTITTADAKLARLLEPRAPRPDLRFEAVKTLRAAGLTAGILCSPLLPGITDNYAALKTVARRASAAGASFFAAQPLFLKSCSRPTFLGFVREHFPHLSGDYATRFATQDFAGRAYRESLQGVVRKVCREHGLAERSTDALLTRDVGAGRRQAANVGAVEQARLFA